MELGAFAAALVRRWYIVVVALALSAGGCVLAASSVGPTYESKASVLLFPPAKYGGADEEGGNPYLELDGLSQARDILIRALTSQSARDDLADLHPDADYTMVPDATSSGPIVVVEVSAPTAMEALAAQRVLLAEFPGTLAGLQQELGLDQAELITTRELTVDDRATAVHKSQVRASIVATVALLAVSLALIGLVDGLLVSRAGSRASEEHLPTHDEPVGDSDHQLPDPDQETLPLLGRTDDEEMPPPDAGRGARDPDPVRGPEIDASSASPQSQISKQVYRRRDETVRRVRESPYLEAAEHALSRTGHRPEPADSGDSLREMDRAGT